MRLNNNMRDSDTSYAHRAFPVQSLFWKLSNVRTHCRFGPFQELVALNILNAQLSLNVDCSALVISTPVWGTSQSNRCVIQGLFATSGGYAHLFGTF